MEIFHMKSSKANIILLLKCNDNCKYASMNDNNNNYNSVIVILYAFAI